MSFKIEQALGFFEKVADFGINSAIGFPIGFLLGKLLGPVRLKLTSQLPSEDGI